VADYESKQADYGLTRLTTVSIVQSQLPQKKIWKKLTHVEQEGVENYTTGFGEKFNNVKI